MLTVIVIPCLNERTTIEAAARSLGFGIGEKLAPAETILVLVDNASTDGTGAALAGIRKASRAGTVVTTFEAEHGYVPPRAKGLEIAAKLASSLGYAADQTLILQADADSRYSEGYTDAFRQAAGSADGPTLFEALTKPPHQFIRHHPGFQELADAVDAEMAPFLVDDTLDVVVDDKVSGYLLSDYRAWGGHRREYRASGKEIHAETSRLYMRGRHVGAQRVQIADAYAIPSRRKILRNPVRHFATAGFPRDESWWRAWSSRYDGPREIGAFECKDARCALAPAIECRRAHLLAMMSLLPFVAAGTVVVADARRRAKLHPLVDAHLSGLQNLPSNIDVPGLFEVAFTAIDAWQGPLKTSWRAKT